MGSGRLSRLELNSRAKRIKLLLLDVDGVLTDGRIIIDSQGSQVKAFHVRDGFGLVLAREAGLKRAFLTAERTPAVAARAKQLKIDWVTQGAKDKLAVFKRCLTHFRFSPDQVSYVGDDLLDLPILTRVGLSMTVPEAPIEVRQRVHYVTMASGGKGAVREIVEVLLRAQGKWGPFVRRYLSVRG